MSCLLGICGGYREDSDELELMLREVMARRAKAACDFVEYGTERWRTTTVVDNNQTALCRTYEDEGYWVQISGVFFGHDVRSDAFFPEFISHYERDGASCIRNYRGHFLVQVMDKRRSLLQIFVDPVATSPLYYHQHGGRVFYSSELKALLPVGTATKVWNREAVMQSYLLGYLLDERTVLKDVGCLRGGHYLEISMHEGHYSTHPYYEIDVCRERINSGLSLEVAHDVFEECITDSVGSLDGLFSGAGCHPLVTLSGGLDSRAVLALLSRFRQSPIRTLSWGQINSDDHLYGNRVAQMMNTQHLYKSYSDGSWLIDHLERTVASYECMYSYMDTARAHFLLHDMSIGEGAPLYTGLSGDMIMGSFISWRDLLNRPRSIDWDVLAKRMMRELTNVSFYGMSSFVDALGGENVQIVQDNLRDSMQDMHKEGDEYFAFIDKWNLYNKQSRGIVAYFRGIEEYTAFCSPFYDSRLIEFALSMPLRFRFNEMAYISFLANRVFGRGLRNIPWQKSHLPISRNGYWNTVLTLGKKAIGKVSRGEDLFSSAGNANPYNMWLDKNRRMREFIYEGLSDPDAAAFLFLDSSKLKRLLDSWVSDTRPYIGLNLNLIYMLPILHFAKKYKQYISLPCSD
jgi:asparagine synthetase B (glutamine-hydrolysing)